MSKNFNIFLGFVIGSVVGFIAGSKLMERRFQQHAEEEIESVKRAFRNRTKNVEHDSVKPNTTTLKQQPQDNKNAKTEKEAPKERRLDYAHYYSKNANVSEKEDEKKDGAEDEIYVIPPDEFDTEEGYEAISLRVFEDGIVTDDGLNPMTEEEIENSVTRKNLERIGEYEPDSVFVRNEKRKVDYEVISYFEKYSDVMKNKYHPR